MLLGLVMIVRNESHGIAETLASVRPYIDHWTILDTKSEDDTVDIVRRELAGIPGDLIEEPFVDFATSRNRALDLHGTKTVFVLMLDSDDRLCNGGALRVHLANAVAVGALLIERRGPLSWWVPLVTATTARWRYHGRVHEFLCGPNGEIAQERVPGVAIVQVRSPRSASATFSRWKRDLDLLRAEIVERPRDPRTLFYLAQTYECLGMNAEALTVYQERIAVGGWRDETFEAMLRRAHVMERLQLPWPAIHAAYLEAFEFSPDRAEPLVAIAEHYRLVGAFTLCFMFARWAADLPMPKTGLFVERDAYEWRAHDLVAISAYYIGRRLGDERVLDLGRRAADVAISARPDDPRLRANRAFYDAVQPPVATQESPS